MKRSSRLTAKGDLLGNTRGRTHAASVPVVSFIGLLIGRQRWRKILIDMKLDSGGVEMSTAKYCFKSPALLQVIHSPAAHPPDRADTSAPPHTPS
jgi:hypothetical protein